MRWVTVSLGDRSYPVGVGRGWLRDLGRHPRARGVLEGRRVFVASDRTVWPLHGGRLLEGLASAGARVLGRAELAPGEAHKTIEAVQGLWDALIAAGIERGDCLAALGGGVVGDVAGFAAATCLRGIDLVQVPTTLLAMVDSSVGGKTGVDHPRGKNLIGAFHQPLLVAADLETLGTLPRREVLSGLAEVIKAALLGDPDLFGLLERAGPGLADDPGALEEVVARAVALKARIVEADEREGGRRALLNLGHTLGHAVEVAAGYGTLTHGEAVALGTAFAARLSERMGLLPGREARRIVGLIRAWGYPLRVQRATAEKVLKALRHDKKSRGGEPRWVLLRGIGQAEWGHRVPGEVVAHLLSEFWEDR